MDDCPIRTQPIAFLCRYEDTLPSTAHSPLACRNRHGLSQNPGLHQHFPPLIYLLSPCQLLAPTRKHSRREMLQLLIQPHFRANKSYAQYLSHPSGASTVCKQHTIQPSLSTNVLDFHRPILIHRRLHDRVRDSWFDILSHHLHGIAR